MAAILETDNQLILEKIREGNPAITEKLYNELRPLFISWSRQVYECSEETNIDIFQRAFTIFYFNIKEGKLTELSSSIKTYIISIGKNLYREHFRDKYKQYVKSIDDTPEVYQQLDGNILDEYNNEHNKALVSKLLDTIGDPCKKLLTLTYIYNYSLEALVEEMNYSDERVVRKRKCLCLKKLREIMRDMREADL